jgi:hypothetical protein
VCDKESGTLFIGNSPNVLNDINLDKMLIQEHILVAVHQEFATKQGQTIIAQKTI